MIKHTRKTVVESGNLSAFDADLIPFFMNPLEKHKSLETFFILDKLEDCGDYMQTINAVHA